MQEIYVYDLKKEGSVQVSEHFKVREYKCKDGSNMVFIDPVLASLVERIRKACGKAITINSGYRTVSHNKSIGGATNSYHCYGRAADLNCPKGMTMTEFKKHVDAVMGQKYGVIYYSNFIHIDTRETKYRAQGKT